MSDLSTIIIGTGSYVPSRVVPNSDFLNHEFYEQNGDSIRYSDGDLKGQIKPNSEIIATFENVTGIKERRYAEDNQVTSDFALTAAQRALDSASVDKDSLKYIVVAHNFGDVVAGTHYSDLVPSLASRVKRKLGISNSRTVAYDLPFGCPGWVEGLSHSHDRLKEGELALVIGAEILSRVADPHDKDSMIYADGAGAAVVTKRMLDEKRGVLSAVSRGVVSDHPLLWMGRSNNPHYLGRDLFLKMDGHDLFEYALNEVHEVVNQSLEEAHITADLIKLFLIHQANEKMDLRILNKVLKSNGVKLSKQEFMALVPMIMPLTISWLGNSSVATVITLLDLILKGELPPYKIEEGDLLDLVSIGAGDPNINSIIYRAAGTERGYKAAA